MIPLFPLQVLKLERGMIQAKLEIKEREARRKRRAQRQAARSARSMSTMQGAGGGGGGGGGGAIPEDSAVGAAGSSAESQA